MEDANWEQISDFISKDENQKYFSPVELAKINLIHMEFQTRISEIVVPVMARSKKQTFLFKIYR